MLIGGRDRKSFEILFYNTTTRYDSRFRSVWCLYLAARKFLGVSVARTRSRNPPNGPFASGRNRWWDYPSDVINAHPEGKRDVWHEYKCQLFSARCHIGADFVRRDWFNATSLYAIRHSLRFIARDPSVRRNSCCERRLVVHSSWEYADD